MPRPADALILTLTAAVSCGEPTQPPAPAAVSTPIPEATSQRRNETTAGGDSLEPGGAPAPRDLLKGAPAKRFTTRGSVRWKISMDAPISSLRWSPLAGLVVSAGDEVHNVTSWGVDRWHVVAGPGHRIFAVDDKEVIWSPSFDRISDLARWGRQGWKREWSEDLVSDGRGGLYLIDAATVSALGPDGADRWRISLEGLRNLEGPFHCDSGVLFQGVRGLARIAVTISNRGTIMRRTALERGSVVVGASPSCDPLVWRGNDIALLDQRGIEAWVYEIPGLPTVERLPGGFLLAIAGPDRPVELHAITPEGRRAWVRDLPASGRLTDIGVAADRGLEVEAVGMCLDVSSPCARPKGDRGPFNTLITTRADGSFRALVRHVQGHLGFSEHPDGGLVVASSPDESETELTRRDRRDDVVWHTALPGRLSAGPYVGPSGEIYLATCAGWACGPPYLLLAVTDGEDVRTDG